MKIIFLAKVIYYCKNKNILNFQFNKLIFDMENLE